MERKASNRSVKSRRPSVGTRNSSLSKTSTSSGSDPRPATLEDGSLSNISATVYDNCCLFIYCPDHDKVMLTKGTRKFLPHAELGSVKTWTDVSIEAALALLLGKEANPENIQCFKDKSPFEKFALVHLFRFQLPQSERFITRLTYLVVLRSSTISCCQKTSICRWYPLESAMNSQIATIWGPEVSYFANLLSSNGSISETILEFSLQDAFKYMLYSEIDTLSVLSQENKHEDELRKLLVNLSAHDVGVIYADYIDHTFPSFFLSYHSFHIYMAKHEIEMRPAVVRRYFTAFRTQGRPYMGFSELLLGLAAIDARTAHQEARVSLVFRYYDFNKDNALSLKEFKRMYENLHTKRRITENEVRDEMRRIGTINLQNDDEGVSFEAFNRAIGTHTFRGTSKLCRAAVSPFAQIRRSLAGRKIFKTVENARAVLCNRPYKGRCPSCLSDTYEMASNCVTIDSRGRCVDWLPLETLGNPKRLSSEYSLEVTFPSKDSLWLHSLQEKIRAHNVVKGTRENAKGLGGGKPNKEFFSEVKSICLNLGAMVEKEDRVLKLPEPIFVIGDVHGNLADLLSMEQTLWKQIPFLTANYLFLGDYVDRGKWGFECFLYLAIAKLLCPNKIFILRGNHEVRPIQRKYSFFNELIQKYGSKHGQEIFDHFNYVFDRLPFCAVINRSIVSMHGGIPYSIIDLDHLNSVTPHVVADPERQAPSQWQILWSDPQEYTKWTEIAQMQGTVVSTSNLTYMYLHNKKRGTAYFFNEYALDRFLRTNGLQKVIRAHEVPADGYKFDLGRRCITIFSCSHYCSNQNEAAVVFQGREARMRLIRIDTSKNKPSM